MEKLAVGPIGKGVVSLEMTVAENIRALAKKTGSDVEDLTVVVLDRPRHDDRDREPAPVGAAVHALRRAVGSRLPNRCGATPSCRFTNTSPSSVNTFSLCASSIT